MWLHMLLSNLKGHAVMCRIEKKMKFVIHWFGVLGYWSDHSSHWITFNGEVVWCFKFSHCHFSLNTRYTYNWGSSFVHIWLSAFVDIDTFVFCHIFQDSWIEMMVRCEITIGYCLYIVLKSSHPTLPNALEGIKSNVNLIKYWDFLPWFVSPYVFF